MKDFLTPPRGLWLLLAATCAGVFVVSLVLTAWHDLNPCHLCIFQRLVYLLLAVIALAAGWLLPNPAGRWIGFFTIPMAAGGVAVAVYQSWLQWQPPGSVNCVGGDPSLIESLVESLGGLLPELFLATGFCEEAELTILGLTLANWSALGFSACLALAYRAWRPIPERRLFR
jgi:disulfide bond formation protein DsbB